MATQANVLSYHLPLAKNLLLGAEILLIFIIVISLSLFIKKYFDKRRNIAITKENFKNIISEAMQHNCCMSLKLSPSNSMQFIDIYPESVSHDQLIFMSSLQNINIHNLNQDAFVFFYFKKNKRTYYYNFYAKITQVSKYEDQAKCTLEPVTAMQEGQRRHFLRISPHPSMLTCLGAYYASENTLFADCKMEDSPNSTKLIWKHLPKNSYHIQDISAGGMKLLVKETALTDPPMEIGDYLVLKIKLMHKPKKHYTCITVAGSCLYIHTYNFNNGNNAKAISIMFKYQTIYNERLDSIQWVPVKPKTGIKAIEKWIMKVQFYIWPNTEDK